MSTNIEKLDNGKVKLTFTIPAEEFEAGCEKAYQDTKDRFEITGFRRGKAPRAIIEKKYGERLFYEDGLRNSFLNAYQRTVAKEALAPIGFPSITEIDPIEKGRDLTLSVEVLLKPEVKLGAYKGLAVTRPDTRATDEDVLNELLSVWQMYSDPEAEEEPQIDDAFAAHVSDYETLEEYKAFLKEQIHKQKEEAAAEQLKNDLMTRVIEDAKVDVPEVMVDEECTNQLNSLKETLATQGMAFDDYLEFSGTTEEQIVTEFRPQAEKNVRARLVMEAIAKAEGFCVEDAELEAELLEMANAYETDPESIRDYFTEIAPAIEADLLMRKAMDLILETAVVEQL